MTSAAMGRGHSDAITEGVRIRVGAKYVPEESDPGAGLFMYVYRVIISNEGDQPVRLLSRHWIIRDAEGDRREVRGPGVVGQQPLIDPGEDFEYVSGCPLPTAWGTMEGCYTMEREGGGTFEATIAQFFLARNVAPISEL